MAARKTTNKKQYWVVLVDEDICESPDIDSVLGVCCGQHYSSEAAARKEAKRHPEAVGIAKIMFAVKTTTDFVAV